MTKKIIFTIAAVAIFCAGYFGIFEKRKDGYDNYAFKGDPYYADYGRKSYDNTWGASDYKYDGSYDTKDKYNDPYVPTGSWDYTDSGVTHYK